MFQPSLRAFDGSGAIAITGPFPALSSRLSSRLAALPQIDIRQIAHLDLVVDLGGSIGSRTWWRGLATLFALGWLAIAIGTRPVGLPAAVPPALLPVQAPLARTAVIEPLALGGTTGEVALPTDKVRRLAEPPERPRIEVTARLGRSDSINGALRRAGVGASEVATLSRMIGDAVSLRAVKPGTAFDLVLGRRESKSQPRPLESLAFRAAFDLKLEVTRGDDGALRLKRIPIKVDNTPLRVRGTVGGSLYRAARAAGLPARVVADAIKALSYTIDIQRDVRGRDRFDLVVAHRRAETGETETGELLYAAIDGRKDAAVMRWGDGRGSAFYLPDGSSARKGLMRTPVDGARLTSGFGFRTHPILGYSRLHQGVDFGAPHGAPIVAAASGTVEIAGWHGGHGNYVRISHGKGIATAYAHMSRIAARPGARVEQGQVIGYVGSTGLSTGPHLHYEVYVGGRAVDPRSAKFRSGTQLVGGEMARFRAKLNQLRGVRVADGSSDKASGLAQSDSKPGDEG